MNCEEIQKIWDTQNARPLYAFDEKALRRSVRRKAREFKQMIVVFEAPVMAAMLGLGMFYASAALSRDNTPGWFPPRFVWELRHIS